jgi:hypothetical protein
MYRSQPRRTVRAQRADRSIVEQINHTIDWYNLVAFGVCFFSANKLSAARHRRPAADDKALVEMLAAEIPESQEAQSEHGGGGSAIWNRRAASDPGAEL